MKANGSSHRISLGTSGGNELSVDCIRSAMTSYSTESFGAALELVKMFQTKGKAWEVKIKMKDQRTRSYGASGEILKLQHQNHRGTCDKCTFLLLVPPCFQSPMLVT